MNTELQFVTYNEFVKSLNEASEADLSTGNLIAMAGTEPSKLPAGAVAQKSIQENAVLSIAPNYNKTKSGGYRVGERFMFGGRLKIVKSPIPYNTADPSSYVDDFSENEDGAVIRSEKSDVFYAVKIGANFYKCVKIGNKLWMAENLREPIGTENSDYYTPWGDAASSSKYGLGLLYKWGTVCASDGSVSSSLSALIPSQNWKVPSSDDVADLAAGVGAVADRIGLYASSSLWTIETPTDKFGFGMLPCGYYNGSSVVKNQMAFIWTSSSASSANAYDVYFQANGTVSTTDSSSKTNRAFSVRLCLDLNPDGSIPSGNGVIVRKLSSRPPRSGAYFRFVDNGIERLVAESEIIDAEQTVDVYGFVTGEFSMVAGGRVQSLKTCTVEIDLENGFDYSFTIGSGSPADGHGTYWVYVQKADGTVAYINDTSISASSNYKKLFVNLKKTSDANLTNDDIINSYITLTKSGTLKKFATTEKKDAVESSSDKTCCQEVGVLNQELAVAREAIAAAVNVRINDEAGSDSVELVSSSGGKFIFNLHKRAQGDYGKYGDFYLPGARDDFSDVQFFDQNGNRLKSSFVSKVDCDILPDTRLKIYKKVRGNSQGVVFGKNGDSIVTSSDNGVTWTAVSAFSDGNYTPLIFTSEDSLLASDSNGNIYRSEAPYSSKSLVLNLYSVYGEVLTIGSYQVDGDDDGNIYVGTYKLSYGNNKIYKSSDDGVTWDAVLEDSVYQHVHHIYVDRNVTPNAIYAGFDGDTQSGHRQGGIFKSVDAGETWVDLRDEVSDIPQATDHGVIYAADGFRLLGGESSTVNYSASIIRTEDDEHFEIVMSNGKAVFSVVAFGGLLIGCSNSSTQFKSSELLVSNDQGKTWKSVLCSSYDGTSAEDGGLNTISVVGDEAWVWSRNTSARENVNRRVVSGKFAEVIVEVPSGVTSVTAKCGYIMPDLYIQNVEKNVGNLIYAPLNENCDECAVFINGVKNVMRPGYKWTKSDSARLGNIYPAVKSAVDDFAAVIEKNSTEKFSLSIPSGGLHISMWVKWKNTGYKGQLDFIAGNGYAISMSPYYVGYFDTSFHNVALIIAQCPLDVFQKLDITIDENGACRTFVNGIQKGSGSGFDLSLLSGPYFILSNRMDNAELAIQHFSVSSTIPTDQQIRDSYFGGLNDNKSR